MTQSLWHSLAAGYLIGSVPFGLLVGWSRGVDVRRSGSGNIGASNCARLLGTRAGILVFTLDFTKGLVPTLIFGPAAGCAAIVGHCFPLWLKFDGGKGVATGAGFLLLLAPWATLLSLMVWILIARRTRLASVASMSAIAAFITLATGLDLWLNRPHLSQRISCYLGVAFLLLWRHRHNIVRLKTGEEPGVSNELQDQHSG